MFQTQTNAPRGHAATVADRIAKWSARSGGFLTSVAAPDVGFPGAVALSANYVHGRFTPRLFADLAIDCPGELADATEKRQAEFLAGRALAQLGQALHGHHPAPVGRSEKGLPQWPHGLAGSISHSAGRCFCLMLPGRDLLVGADTEAFAGGHQLRAILRLVATPEDRFHIDRGPDKAVLATLLFSAKETLFKLLYPVVGHHFGFACAELCALPEAGLLHLRLTRDLHPSLAAGAVFRIGYFLGPSHVTSWAVASAPSPHGQVQGSVSDSKVDQRPALPKPWVASVLG